MQPSIVALVLCAPSFLPSLVAVPRTYVRVLLITRDLGGAMAFAELEFGQEVAFWCIPQKIPMHPTPVRICG